MLVQKQADTLSLAQVLEELERNYRNRNAKSHQQVQRASEVLPGGSTRSVLHFDPFPLVISKASGSTVTDLDGHTYVDFSNDFTAGFYGHSDPVIATAMTEAIHCGLSFGGPNLYEERLARNICARFASIDRVRFCNSGTEANLIAFQLARQATGRNKILAFNGGYHGSMISFLGGMNLNYGTSDFVFADFNSAPSVEASANSVGDDLAAIVVEPMIGSGGGILANREFLQFLREYTQKHRVLLIFDEVQTARMAGGGLQEFFHIRPDLTTLGKFLGGGASFGAFGGSLAVMTLLDATKPGAIPHGGTFNNNILSMAAGDAGLSKVATPSAIEAANGLAAGLRERLCLVGSRLGIPLQLGGYGTIISIHFQDSPITRPSDIKTNAQQRKLVHLELLARGIYAARRGTINFSLATTSADAQAYADAFEEVCATHSNWLRNN